MSSTFSKKHPVLLRRGAEAEPPKSRSRIARFAWRSRARHRERSKARTTKDSKFPRPAGNRKGQQMQRAAATSRSFPPMARTAGHNKGGSCDLPFKFLIFLFLAFSSNTHVGKFWLFFSFWVAIYPGRGQDILPVCKIFPLAGAQHRN